MSPDKKVKILLVDDRPENLIALESVLESLGQVLVKASSGAEALKRLLDEEFAVILLDVQMPGMDGFEAASLIRSREKTRHIPIIFLTAFNKTDQHAVKGYSLGAVDYIFKPFEPDLLRAKVAAFVELSKKTLEWREEIVQRRRAEEKLDASNALLETISRTLVGFISHSDPAVACQNLLGRILTLTQSEYGFIGEILYTDRGEPYVRILAVSNISGADGRKPESRFRASAQGTEALCRALQESGQLLLANTRAAVPRGLPPGHPPLMNFVGLPFYKAEMLVGMLGIGNRLGGYTEEMVAYLEPLRSTCAAIIDAYRLEQRRKQAEAAVRELNEDLERRVFERTAALESANKELENEVAERARAQTALIEAKEAAEVANSAKTRFLASMSHELRTPLNAIIGYSEMLQEEASDLGLNDLLPDLGKIHAAGKHLLALINDVLDLAKIEAGKEFLSLETFDILAMIEQVVGTAQPLAQKNGNTLEVRCPPDIGSMRADSTKVRQSLLNLLSNACKFTEQGVITLEVSRQEQDKRGWVLFRVADTGIGIPSDQMGRLFEPFSQAHTETVRRYGGTGLGLTITQQYCRMMQGDVSVESEPGNGSTFTIRLPREVQDPKSPPAPRKPSSSRPTASSKSTAGTVLVIDDDPTARDLMKRFLTREGIRVKTAASGAEGLHLARTIRPAAITLDVMMPDMDGWAVLSALKADPKLCDIPVIMLTMVDDRKEGYTLGAADYMVKPVDWNRLKSILDRHRCLQPPCPVLIVEDDSDSRQLLRSMLERGGWVVAEAENGRAALDCIQENRPALILLDLLMPDMDGFSLVSALRGHADWRSIPVVIITAKDITEEDRLQLNGHVEKILQKGAYNREALLDEVRYLVQTCV